MGTRALRRAVALTAVIGLLGAGAVFADSIRSDGDVVDPDLDSLVELGPMAPGAVIVREVGFELHCSGFVHVNADQRVVLTPGTRSIPAGGAAEYTATAFQAPGSGWPEDGSLCNDTHEPIPAAGTSTVTLTAPMTPGEGYLYTLQWTRSLDPVAAGDSGTFSGLTAVSFSLDVVANTPPTLHLPETVELEGDTTGGAVAAYEVSATDAEDDPDPTPSCTPESRTVVPVGVTTVQCTVTDAGGMTATGSFDIVVTDTLAPALAGGPSGLRLATADPAGTTLAYTPPTATDTVDPAPAVACLPAPGSVAPVGDSTVTCTATDSNGNTSSASFPVHVTLWTAAWDEPIGTRASITANAGRTVPVKVRLFADGTEVKTGAPVVHVSSCDGNGTVIDGALAWSSGNGRWNGHLDTSLLGGTGCYRVWIDIEGLKVASFGLEVTGSVTPVRSPVKAIR